MVTEPPRLESGGGGEGERQVSLVDYTRDSLLTSEFETSMNCITDELDRRVIDNAVIRQWRTRLHACLNKRHPLGTHAARITIALLSFNTVILDFTVCCRCLRHIFLLFRCINEHVYSLKRQCKIKIKYKYKDRTELADIYSAHRLLTSS